MRLCLDRTARFLPPIRSAADILGAIKVVSGAVGRGAITPGEGVAIYQMIESFLRAIDADNSKTGCGNWKKTQTGAVQILMGLPSATVELGMGPPLRP